MMQVKLTNVPHLSKYFDKNSEDTQQLLISWEQKSSKQVIIQFYEHLRLRI
jgi:hypothetical protein